MRAPTRPLLVSVLVLLAAAPASAGNLTGVWEGKYSCKAQDARGKLKLSGLSTLEITQPDTAGSPALQARIDGVPFAGFVLETGASLGGVGALVGCDPGDIRSLRWKVKPDDVKAKISWRGVFVSNDAMISSCRGSWSRVSLAEPTPAIDVGTCR
jgi:hypothetical protein